MSVLVQAPQRGRDGLFKEPDDFGPDFESTEEHRREIAANHFHYADNLGSGNPTTYDKAGRYNCGRCNQAQGSKCLLVDLKKIDREAGSCGDWEQIRAGDAELPLKQKTPEQAGYGVAANGDGFGCFRCPYGHATQADSQGRDWWCGKFAARTLRTACCSLNGAELVPGSERGDRSDGLPPTYLRMDAHEGSVWICIKLPADACAAIEPLFVGDTEEQTTGVGPHVTLLYLGKKSKFTDEQLKAARATVAQVGARTDPLDFSFGGAGKFVQSKQSGGKTPIYLTPNAPGLARLRGELQDQLRWSAKIELDSPFDFIPHVCLGYVEDPETPVPSEVPDVRWTTRELWFIVNGEDEQSFPLVGQPDFKELRKLEEKSDDLPEEDTPFGKIAAGKDVGSPKAFAGGTQHGMPKRRGGSGGQSMGHKVDIIEKQKGQFVLKSHEGKTLGGPYSEGEAKSQESAINIAKARAAGHHIAKPTDADEFQQFLTKQNVGDPDLEEAGIPERRGNKWVILKNGEVAGEYDLENEKIHLEGTFANPALGKAPVPTGSVAAEKGTSPDVKEPVPGADKSFNKDCKRYDVGTLDKPVKMRNGWLKADAFITRTGVFRYRNSDGSERRELRLASEVFNPESLSSFQMVPVTDDHPPVFLNDSNYRKWHRGQMGDSVRGDGELVRGPMVVMDSGLIGKMESGEQVQVSCGYTCDLEPKEGVTDDGERYDCIQRNIRGNHVAIVPVARAGEAAHVRMDSAAWSMVRIQDGSGKTAPPSGGTLVADKTIKVGGKVLKAGSPEAEAALKENKAHLDSLSEQVTKAEAFAKEHRDDAGDFAGEYMKKLDELKHAHDKAKALHDAAYDVHKTAKGLHDDASAAMGEEYAKTKEMLESQQKHAVEEKARADAAEKKLKTAREDAVESFKARQTLESIARRMLGRKEKFDGLSDKEIKLKVLNRVAPEIEFKGKNETYIEARFDIAVEEFQPEEGAEHVVVDAADEVEEMEFGQTRYDAMDFETAMKEASKPHRDKDDAYEAMLWRGKNQWRLPIEPTPRQLTSR